MYAHMPMLGYSVHISKQQNAVYFNKFKFLLFFENNKEAEKVEVNYEKLKN
jgi:hypothetical protein